MPGTDDAEPMPDATKDEGLTASDVAALQTAGILPLPSPPLPTVEQAKLAATSQWPPAGTAYCAIDTETSGLFIFTEEKGGKRVTVAADDPRQPRLAQAAMLALNEDLVELGRYTGYVYPDGWVMMPEVTEKNGLTTEFLRARGRPIAEVLDAYALVVGTGAVIVAHNAQFDTKMMRGELRRAGRDDLFKVTKNFCTMRKWAERQGGRWPNLAKMCAMLDIVLSDRHTAIGDCEALAACMRKMRPIGFVFEGEVHTSKFRDDGAA